MRGRLRRPFPEEGDRPPVKLVVFDFDETMTLATFMSGDGAYREEQRAVTAQAPPLSRGARAATRAPEPRGGAHGASLIGAILVSGMVMSMRTTHAAHEAASRRWPGSTGRHALKPRGCLLARAGSGRPV